MDQHSHIEHSILNPGFVCLTITAVVNLIILFVLMPAWKYILIDGLITREECAIALWIVRLRGTNIIEHHDIDYRRPTHQVRQMIKLAGIL